jgi:isopentenyl-diphosphate Delta-isomerase
MDYVLIGYYDGAPAINENEAQAWKFESIESIERDVKKNPDQYTCWFKLILSHPELLSLTR